MPKRKNVHFSHEASPACHSRAQDPELTKDRRKVTCENCIRTKAYKFAGVVG